MADVLSAVLSGAGLAALPCFMGHVLMDNRSGLAVNTRLTQANGKAECQAALDMLAALPGTRRKTGGADKAFDT